MLSNPTFFYILCLLFRKRLKAPPASAGPAKIPVSELGGGGGGGESLPPPQKARALGARRRRFLPPTLIRDSRSQLEPPQMHPVFILNCTPALQLVTRDTVPSPNNFLSLTAVTVVV